MNIIKNLIIATLVVFNLSAFSQLESDFEISKNLDIYASIFKELNNHYVDEVHSGKLNRIAIEAMLKDLDPYTNYFPESEIEEVRFIQTGNYGGTGCVLAIKNDTFVVTKVMKGFPFDKNGISVGDKILKIGDESCTGKTMDQMSELMKGPSGTSISVTFKDEKSSAVSSKEIEREEIKVKCVPYYSILENDIAYIKLTTFNTTAFEEFSKALAEMSSKTRLKGLILDLRDNGGGLLDQAVKIVDLFVEPGRPIVETRGKFESENFKYNSISKPLYPSLPVAVMVNGYSASASEIIAGAMQDLDRAVILGQKSYGKGLVQKIFPLSYNAQIKVTVAKYYVPSGRCIQAIDYSQRDQNGKAIKIADSLHTKFFTASKRVVYDAGGILPDITLQHPTSNENLDNLIKKLVIFDFVSMYYSGIQAPSSLENIPSADVIYSEFMKYLTLSGSGVDASMKNELDSMLVIAKLNSNLEAIKSIEVLNIMVENNHARLLSENKDFIVKTIQQEIANRFFYEEGFYSAGLNLDQEVKASIDLLHNSAKYNSILGIK